MYSVKNIRDQKLFVQRRCRELSALGSDTRTIEFNHYLENVRDALDMLREMLSKRYSHEEALNDGT
jgi:hypothetical protein